MCLCACVLVCLCACVLVCLCACVLVCLCACVLVCLCACVLVCLCACVLVCLCACVLGRLCACVLLCLSVCVFGRLCVCVFGCLCLCVSVVSHAVGSKRSSLVLPCAKLGCWGAWSEPRQWQLPRRLLTLPERACRLPDWRQLDSPVPLSAAAGELWLRSVCWSVG